MGRYASVYFSPRRGTADLIIGFIDRCTDTLDVAVYSITHDEIAAALIRAHERGVAVRVLIDHVQASSRYADDEKLEEAGIPLLRDIKGGAMHTKFCIGDGKAVGSGSFNWTMNADTRNAEQWVITRLSYITAEFQTQFDHMWLQNTPKETL